MQHPGQGAWPTFGHNTTFGCFKLRMRATRTRTLRLSVHSGFSLQHLRNPTENSLLHHNRVRVQAEFMNPGGSVKDRAALWLVRVAEESGALRPGGTVVEGTAGNTGIGLAHVCNARGCVRRTRHTSMTGRRGTRRACTRSLALCYGAATVDINLANKMRGSCLPCQFSPTVHSLTCAIARLDRRC